MGSDSDLPVMQGAADALAELGVAHEVRVVSAHRTPHDMIAYGGEAADRGLRVIVAGAGGAAHLPGMLAAVTTLPVIGVPVRSSSLQGLDSLLSIVQMPKGVPVATVAIDGGRNAGLLAAQILALADAELGHRIAGAARRDGRGRARRRRAGERDLTGGRRTRPTAQKDLRHTELTSGPDLPMPAPWPASHDEEIRWTTVREQASGHGAWR